MTTTSFQPGQRVQVYAGGELDHDFSGVVTRTDPGNYLVFVREDGVEAVWGMPACNVYAREESEE